MDHPRKTEDRSHRLPLLIARYIDDAPEFLYVPPSDVMRIAADTGAIPYDVPNVVVGHTATKRAQWQIEHELCKYELALVHDGFGRKPEQNRQSAFRRLNRDQTGTLNLASNSLTYDVRM